VGAGGVGETGGVGLWRINGVIVGIGVGVAIGVKRGVEVVPGVAVAAGVPVGPEVPVGAGVTVAGAGVSVDFEGGGGVGPPGVAVGPAVGTNGVPVIAGVPIGVALGPDVGVVTPLGLVTVSSLQAIAAERISTKPNIPAAARILAPSLPVRTASAPTRVSLHEPGLRPPRLTSESGSE
jgi:hypothetical protein